MVAAFGPTVVGRGGLTVVSTIGVDRVVGAEVLTSVSMGLPFLTVTVSLMVTVSVRGCRWPALTCIPTQGMGESTGLLAGGLQLG